jgi:hypothetical protein
MPELSASLVAALAGAFVDGGGDRVVHPVLPTAARAIR